MKKFLTSLIFGLFLHSSAYAALTANTVWEFQTGGDDTFGGGYDSTIAGAGTDYSTATSAHATLTTLSVVGATTTQIIVSATDYTVASTDVGNIMFLTGGSATAGFYQIVTATTGAGQKWTMDRSVGTAAQTCPGKMGGCRKLLNSNSFSTTVVAGNRIYVKSGTMTLGGNFTGGTSGTTTAPIILEGYNGSRGDTPTGSNRPTIACAGNSFSVVAKWLAKNLVFTTTSTTGINLSGAQAVAINCKSTNSNAGSTQAAFTMGGAGSRLLNCEAIATTCIGVVFTGSNNMLDSCYIHDSLKGLQFSSGISGNVIKSCIFDTLSTSDVEFVGTAQSSITFNGNTFYGAETPSGIGIDSTTDIVGQCIFINNIFYGFTTGVTWNAANASNFWDNNDFFNCTTARTNVTAGTNDVALDPQFTNGPSGDFSIGTNLRALGFPGAFQGGLSTGYTDIGAVQRQETSGSDILGVIQ